KQMLLAGLGSLLMAHSMGQDINFSQFYELPLLRNPALAGIFQGDMRVTSAFRSQWQSVTVPYRTLALGVEYKKPTRRNSNDFLTIGFQVTHDIAGDSRLSRTQVFPVLNFHKSLDSEKDTYLSAGIMGGPVMQRFDPSKLSFDDQFVNGSYSASNPTKQVFSNTGSTYWDAAAGINFSSIAGENTRYYFGVGLFHLTKPKIAFQEKYDIVLNPKWVVNAGLSVPAGDMGKVIVYGDYFMQGGNRQMQGGLLYSRDLVQADEGDKMAFSAGAFYRWKDALMPVVKLDYKQIGIGITYDVNISKLKTASQFRGAYELTLSYKAFRNSPNTSAEMVRCPAFY
ncbi:MAG TPA: PorP/SprF family type IX secretion system membrane protein, partial [Ferruginibacter sp.]|nr:PorP/SprF family type IX secretion system membrane protein [Ferruginibacter sp.]